MKVFEYKLSDQPHWLTMISPTCDLPEARQACELRFGGDRVIDVSERES